MSEDEPTPRRRFGPLRLAALAIGLVVLAVLLGVWFQRKPIAAGYIDRYFADAQVPIRYRIADLNLGRQRLTNVVIGDPAHPDLVADWLETDTRIGLDGAKVLGVRGGRVRMRGRLINGRVSLGNIDRLLPPPSNQPFALPAIDLDVADLRLRLETVAGLVGIKIAGKGRLDGGFVGEAAAAAPVLKVGACGASGVSAAWHVETQRAQPSVSGPIRIAALGCGGTRARNVRADLDATLGPALDTWRGNAKLAVGEVRGAPGFVRAVGGTLTFAGGKRSTGGTVDLRSGRFATDRAEGAALVLSGRYRLARVSAFEGRAGAQDVSVALRLLGQADKLATSTAGTPLRPLSAALTHAIVQAGRRFDVSSDVAVALAGSSGRLVARRIAIAGASGARVTMEGAGLRYAWPAGDLAASGTIRASGGGLPEVSAALAGSARGGFTGHATVARYASGGAELVLDTVWFVAGPNGTRIATAAILSGPLSNGRVEGARIAIDARIGGNGALTLNPSCSDAGFDRLAVAGLNLSAARFRLCPIGPAMVRVAGGRVSGGVSIATPRLAGRLGSTLLTLAATSAQLRLENGVFTLTNVAARLGDEQRLTRLDVGRLDGRIAGGGVGGTFAGAGGQIGNVPLLLSGAAGDWRMANGRLALSGGLTVADAGPQPRFEPLASRDVTLILAGSRIDAKGALVTPKQRVKVADVTIAHDLSRGTGSADLRVPGIAFDKNFQPDALTRLTYGVIADVKGTVSGDGHIAWNPQSVSSTGTFGTQGVDLAAAFGPVTGLKTELHFTDLLGMRTAPGQVATIASVNPGVAVENGTVRYQLLSPTEVQVEGGRWPFAGGNLTLEPTLLDFGQAKVRHMTFRVAGMNAAQFLQQFDFKNLNATGTFDGVLPMTFDADGGRIVDGHLTVRAGGGSIAYVGDLSEKNLGFWGNVAFQALKSLRYRSLNIVMNGPLSGEMVTEVRFAGVSQGQGAKSNFLVKRLTKLPFVFNVTIRAPFRGLIDTAQSFYDPKRLIERNLPALLQQQLQTPPKPVQPPASEKMP